MGQTREPLDDKIRNLEWFAENVIAKALTVWATTRGSVGSGRSSRGSGARSVSG